MGTPGHTPRERNEARAAPIGTASAETSNAAARETAARNIGNMMQSLQHAPRSDQGGRELRLKQIILGNGAAGNMPLEHVPDLTPDQEQQWTALVRSGQAAQYMEQLLTRLRSQSNDPAKIAQYEAAARNLLTPARNIPPTRMQPLEAQPNSLESMQAQPWYQYLSSRIARINQLGTMSLNDDARTELPALNEAFARLSGNMRIPPNTLALVQRYISRERTGIQAMMMTLPQTVDRDQREAALAGHLRLLTAAEEYILSRAEKASG